MQVPMDWRGSAVCADLVHFRNLLKGDRKSDDNIQHKLNAVDASDYSQCASVAKWLSEMHTARKMAIARCLGEYKAVLECDSVPSDLKSVYTKKVGLLQAEQIIEEIVEDRSWSILHERCRILDISSVRPKS